MLNAKRKKISWLDIKRKKILAREIIVAIPVIIVCICIYAFPHIYIYFSQNRLEKYYLLIDDYKWNVQSRVLVLIHKENEKTKVGNLKPGLAKQAKAQVKPGSIQIGDSLLKVLNAKIDLLELKTGNVTDNIDRMRTTSVPGILIFAILIIGFPVRYLIYAFIWAVKVLKENSTI